MTNDLTPESARLLLQDELNQLYRERAQLLAWIAALEPGTVLAPAPDVKDPRWRILFMRTGHGQWQVTWHIAPSDLSLFAGVERVEADDPRAQWDGHTTEQKYQRVRAIVAMLRTPLAPSAPTMCTRRRCIAPGCGPKCSSLIRGI